MENLPKLAPPGKGLPLLQHLYARYWAFPRFCRASTWESALAQHERLGRKILDQARPLSNEALTTRVLVHGVPGIEDSSRFWSVAMTIEHLIIVGERVRLAIGLLSRGETPPGKASIADVKPQGADRKILVEYEAFLARYSVTIKSELRDRASKTTFAHPWFGPLTAFQWHCLAAAHAGLHRRQVEAILKGLPAKGE